MVVELALALASGVSPLLQLPGQKPAPRDFGKLYELNPPKTFKLMPLRPKQAPIRLLEPSRPCSIPLTETLRPGDPQPPMKVIPAPRLRMRQAVLPAPPCDK